MADPSRRIPTERWWLRPEVRRLPPEPWQRFTLLDLFLIQLGFALGFSAAAILRPKEAPAAFVLVAGSFFGVLACGPIVLWVQWAIRDRWARLSAGEWLWLATSALYALAVCAGVFVAVTKSGSVVGLFLAPAVGAWLLAQLACVIVALWTLIVTLPGARPDVPCGWTDRVGIAVSLLGNLPTCILLWWLATFAARA
jgi:hypothetical protein